MEHSWLEYEPTFTRKATALALGMVFLGGGRNPTWAKWWASPLLAPGLLSLCPEMGFQPRDTSFTRNKLTIISKALIRR